MVHGSELIELTGHFEQLMTLAGDKPRLGTVETPGRAAKAFMELTRGYREDPDQHVKLFESSSNEMVVVPDIEFASLCEHHLLPYIGKCNIGYLPDGKLLGLSKFSRIVDLMSRRFTVQEELTTQIAAFLNYRLGCRGIVVEMRAKHLCMCIRGVRANSPYAITSKVMGVFKTVPSVRAEFYSLLGREKNFI